jgi:hypothetical protein
MTITIHGYSLSKNVRNAVTKKLMDAVERSPDGLIADARSGYSQDSGYLAVFPPAAGNCQNSKSGRWPGQYPPAREKETAPAGGGRGHLWGRTTRVRPATFGCSRSHFAQSQRSVLLIHCPKLSARVSKLGQHAPFPRGIGKSGSGRRKGARIYGLLAVGLAAVQFDKIDQQQSVRWLIIVFGLGKQGTLVW